MSTRRKDFYFKVDPFTYEHISHFTSQELSLSGQFVGGNILKPTRQYLTIQENNSLGFRMAIPAEGIEMYGGRGRLFDELNISNKGLIGSGIFKHLTATTRIWMNTSLYPDSMLTHATSFTMDKDPSGIFPILKSQDVTIKWLTQRDEWLATIAKGKSFEMFDNGTTLDGYLNLMPSKLSGTGIINMTNSRVSSNLFSFESNAIKADTADYNLKSSTTSGYSFIAENASTDINFELKLSRFHLNTDSSMVKFPEIQYICTMTDFEYNMDTRVLSMEQKVSQHFISS